MAEMDDPLGSFFEEINQLPAASEVVSSSEAAPATNSSASTEINTNIDKKDTTSTIAATIATSTIASTPTITYKAKAQIISKPAEIISKKPTVDVSSGTAAPFLPPQARQPSTLQSYHTHYQGPSGPTPSSSSSSSGSSSSNVIPSGASKPQSQFAFHSASTVTVTAVNQKAAADNRPPQPLTAQPGKKFVRKAAGEVWVDESLNEWPENDYRIFVGDLAKEITTSDLEKPFKQYASFAKAKVVRSKYDNKAKGYGFISFLDPMDCAKAIREQNGKYLGQRPMKITKSSWRDRDMGEVKKKENKKRKLQESMGLI